jgi:hypothetical protein
LIESPRRGQISRFRRIVSVTLALSGIGAVVGAVLGVLSLAAVYIAVRGWRTVGGLAEPFAFAAVFGGVLGFVLAPIAAWTLMRHVPLWRAIAETAVGTIVGFGAGWLLVLGVDKPSPLIHPLVLALVGFVAAAIRLRLTHRGAGRAVSDSGASSR